jgi:hypothetical protein
MTYGALRRGVCRGGVRDIAAAGSGPRRCATAQEEAGQAARPPAARLPIILRRQSTRPARSRFHVCPAHPPRDRPQPVGLARRRCALEAVEKVVTVRRDLFDHVFVLGYLVSVGARLGLGSPRFDPAGPCPDALHPTVLILRPVAYSLPVTTPNGQHSAIADEAALASRDRARSRWKVARIFVAIAILGALILGFALVGDSSGTLDVCPPSGCPASPATEPSQVWVAVTALGAFAAGVGTLVSAIAAVLALRAATAARASTAAPAKKSPVKRTRKR